MMLNGPVLLEMIQLQKTLKNSFSEEKPFQQVLIKLYFSISITKIKIKNISVIQRYSSCPFNQAPPSALSSKKPLTCSILYFLDFHLSGIKLTCSFMSCFFY